MQNANANFFTAESAENTEMLRDDCYGILQCLGHYLRKMLKLASAAESGNAMPIKDFYYALSVLPRFAAVPIRAFISKNAHER